MQGPRDVEAMPRARRDGENTALPSALPSALLSALPGPALPSPAPAFPPVVRARALPHASDRGRVECSSSGTLMDWGQKGVLVVDRGS